MSFIFPLNQALTGQQILSLVSYSAARGNVDEVADKVVNPSSIVSQSLFFCRGLVALKPSNALSTSICLATPTAARRLPSVGLLVEVQDPIAELSKILLKTDGDGVLFQTRWMEKNTISELMMGISGEIDLTALIANGTSFAESPIVGPGAQIGVTGLGFVDQADGGRIRVPHLGRVKLGRHVVIGAGSVVVRGQFSDTVIGDYVRLGNLVNVGHNCIIGDRSIISSGTIIGGGCIIGDDVEMGVGVTVSPKVTIGRRAFVAAGSVVLRNVQSGTMVSGNPATVVRRGN